MPIKFFVNLVMVLIFVSAPAYASNKAMGVFKIPGGPEVPVWNTPCGDFFKRDMTSTDPVVFKILREQNEACRDFIEEGTDLVLKIEKANLKKEESRFDQKMEESKLDRRYALDVRRQTQREADGLHRRGRDIHRDVLRENRELHRQKIEHKRQVLRGQDQDERHMINRSREARRWGDDIIDWVGDLERVADRSRRSRSR